MALIKCKGCGHMISDKAEACPKCGWSEERRETGSVAKWPLLALLLLLLVGGGAACYFYWLPKNAPSAAVNRQKALSDVGRGEVERGHREGMADGRYIYTGYWESSQHAAQPCKLEFEKNGDKLTNCAYTNLNYPARVQLQGSLKNGKLHFVGLNGKEHLMIDLQAAPDGSTLTGEGVDYAHSGKKAKLNLTRGEKALTKRLPEAETVGTAHQESDVNDLIFDDRPVSSEIYMVFNGRIGGDENAELRLEGQTGEYRFLNYKREVRISEYDEPTGQLVLMGYERGTGKYIGRFDGCLDYNDGWYEYSGKFTNYKGVSLTFSLRHLASR